MPVLVRSGRVECILLAVVRCGWVGGVRVEMVVRADSFILSFAVLGLVECA